MSETAVLREKAEMFQRRAETATDPISEQHYRQMAAHYRQLLVEQSQSGRDGRLSELGFAYTGRGPVLISAS